MKTEVPDIYQTLEYKPGAAIMDAVPSALCLCLFALFMLALDDNPPVRIVIAIGIILIAGVGGIAFAFFRRSHPGRAPFVLSPTGILYRISRSREVFIPWYEIQNIDTINIVTENWATRYSYLSPKLRFKDVTVVVISRRFYDSHIAIKSSFLRGPWRAHFIPKGSSMQIALHHEPLTVEPRVLREAVEARWHAFRHQLPGSAPLPTEDCKSVDLARANVPTATAASRNTAGRSDATARSGPTTVVGAAPRRMSAWKAVKLVIPSIGIAVVLANLFGLWATPGQIASRREREKWAEERRRSKEEQRQLQEKQSETEKRIQELLRRAR